jgi:hypothetical protein
MCGRALPIGNDRKEREALDQHYTDLTSSWETPPDLLLRAQDYARRWAERYLPKRPDYAHVAGITSGGSATYDKSRAEGGLSASLQELMWLRDGSLHTESPPTISTSSWFGLLNEVQQVADVLLDPDHADPPLGRVAVVRERGLKIRIVTAMQRDTLVLGHLARRRLALG